MYNHSHFDDVSQGRSGYIRPSKQNKKTQTTGAAASLSVNYMIVEDADGIFVYYFSSERARGIYKSRLFFCSGMKGIFSTPRIEIGPAIITSFSKSCSPAKNAYYIMFGFFYLLGHEVHDRLG